MNPKAGNQLTTTTQDPHSLGAPLGSRLFGTVMEGKRDAARSVALILWSSLTFAYVSVSTICALLLAGIPAEPSLFDPQFRVVTAAIVPPCLLVSYISALLLSGRYIHKTLPWYVAGQKPSPLDRRNVLYGPRRLTQIQLLSWLTAAITCTALYAAIDIHVFPRFALILFGGTIIMATTCYLFTEFALRPLAASVLEVYGPRPRRLSGLSQRIILTWIVGTGVPIIGLILLSFFAMAEPAYTVRDFAVAVIFGSCLVLILGGVLLLQGVNAIAPPLNLLRRGMTAVSRGDLNTRLMVFDGAEIGELQAGFNEMVEGLQTRDEVKELFSRHVGQAVADEAIRSGTKLGGEERLVAVLFVDIIGSTAIAMERPPTEVVDLLNRFFAIVVEEVHDHGGMINKFAGDAALAVFGAPLLHPDPAGAALETARLIVSRLSVELPDTTTALGIAAGMAVAGNVGAAERLEYTVVGDPVNQASRLSDLAKLDPGHILASGSAVDLADTHEASLWTLGENVTLRGRRIPTQLARPLSGATKIEPA